MDKFAKWGSLLAILSAVLVLCFNEFVPKYMAWRAMYPPEPDEDEERGPEQPQVMQPVGLVDPLRDSFSQDIGKFEQGS